MKRVAKGSPGYLRSRKQIEFIKTLVLLILVLAIFVTGLVTTHSRKNWFTLIAVLGCLPLAQAAVHWIVTIPYRSVSDELVRQIQKAAGESHISYEYVFTSRDANYAVDVIKIGCGCICGYASDPKLNITEAENHLRKQLGESGFRDITVKIFDKPDQFCRRVSEICEKENHDQGTETIEMRIESLLRSISL